MGQESMMKRFLVYIIGMVLLSGCSPSDLGGGAETATLQQSIVNGTLDPQVVELRV